MFTTHSPMELKEPQVRVIFWQSLFTSLKQLYKAQPQKMLFNDGTLPRTQMSLSQWKCKRKGRWEGDNPSHGPLRFITSHSRFALASTMRKTKRLRRRLDGTSAIRSKGWILLHTDLNKAKPNVLGSIVFILGRIKCTRGNGRNSLVIKTSNWLLSAYQDFKMKALLITYSQTSTNDHLSTTATSLQRQRPLMHVPNCQNNLSTTASFLSDWWKSQEWSRIDLYSMFMINRGNRILILFHSYSCKIANLACFVTFLAFWFMT